MIREHVIVHRPHPDTRDLQREQSSSQGLPCIAQAVQSFYTLKLVWWVQLQFCRHSYTNVASITEQPLPGGPRKITTDLPDSLRQKS